MSRPARLLNLVQALSRRRHPVPTAELAAELGVSLRTVYRDIAALAAEGAPIEGAAGLGYVLRPGFFLPPLMFSEDELDALILDLRLAAKRGDPDLQKAADDALAKIVAVLPAEREDTAAISGLRVPGSPEPQPHLATLRLTIRNEQKLRLAYLDKKDRASRCPSPACPAGQPA